MAASRAGAIRHPRFRTPSVSIILWAVLVLGLAIYGNFIWNAILSVAARIVTYEWGEYLRRIDAGEHDAALSGWNGDPEPANTAGQLACNSNSGTFWCNPAYDRLLSEARQALKQEDRKVLYSKAQKIALEQLPWTAIGYGKLAVPERATVKGFVLDLDGGMYFDGVLPK